MLTEEYVRGFVDGEGSFIIAIKAKWSTGRIRGRPAKNSTPRDVHNPTLDLFSERRSLYQVFCVFAVGQTGDCGKKVLEEIQRLLGCGQISCYVPKNPKKSPSYKYTVYAVKDHVNKLVPFFEAHPPVVKNRAYSIWKEAVDTIHKGHHLSREGLTDLLNCKRRLEQVNYKGRSGRGGKWETHVAAFVPPPRL